MEKRKDPKSKTTLKLPLPVVQINVIVVQGHLVNINEILSWSVIKGKSVTLTLSKKHFSAGREI